MILLSRNNLHIPFYITSVKNLVVVAQKEKSIFQITRKIVLKKLAFVFPSKSVADK